MRDTMACREVLRVIQSIGIKRVRIFHQVFLTIITLYVIILMEPKDVLVILTIGIVWRLVIPVDLMCVNGMEVVTRNLLLAHVIHVIQTKLIVRLVDVILVILTVLILKLVLVIRVIQITRIAYYVIVIIVILILHILLLVCVIVVIRIKLTVKTVLVILVIQTVLII